MATKNTTRNFTDAFLRNPKIGTYADAATPGLRLRVGKTRKAFVYRYRDGDHLKQVTIGQYPGTPLEDARAQVRALRQARDSGKDVQREHHRAEEGEYTVKRLVDGYIDGYAKLIKRSWAEDKRMLENDLVGNEKNPNKWGDRPAIEITRVEVIGLLTEMVPRGERGAQLLLAAARKAWNFAIDHEHLSVNPFARLKIVKGVVMSAGTRVRVNKPKPRCLQGAEIKQFLFRLPTANMRPAIRDILRLQLLTASRKGEVCAIRWDEVDLDAGVWTLPAEKAKSGRLHRVMLSTQAQTLIEGQPRINEFLFGVKKRGHMRPDTVNEAVARCRDHFDLGHWTPHALRHSALTGLSKMGARREIQNRISNHADSSVGGRYDHNEFDDEARMWLQRWADHLDGLTVENVVPLERGA